MIPITGNTYPVRRELKALGGRWDPAQQAWLIDDSRADEARAIVQRAGPKRPTFRDSNRRG